MGESEGEFVRVSRRLVGARVGLWMNPMNGDVCVCMCVNERERDIHTCGIMLCGTVDKGGLSSTWRT